MTFGNRNLWIHAVKGIGGFAALWGSLATMKTTLWPSLLLLPLALYLLRGCPICWTIGIFETIVMRLHRRNAETHFESQRSTRTAGKSMNIAGSPVA
jgi:hypothetical protein